MNINYIGAEIVFEKETSPVIQESYLEMQKKKGRILWGNAILYSSRVPLAAGHSDDVSLTDDPAKDGDGLQIKDLTLSRQTGQSIVWIT